MIRPPITGRPRSLLAVLFDLLQAFNGSITGAQKRRMLALLREITQGTELRVDPPPPKRVFYQLTASGTIEGLPVTLSLTPPGLSEPSATLEAQELPMHIGLWTDWAEGLGIIWKETDADETLGLFWNDRAPVRETDILTGSATFDQMIEVRGHVALCLALLDERTRGLVVQVVRHQNAMMRDRRLVMRMQSPGLEAARIRSWASPFLDLVRVLGARLRAGTKACLIENTRREGGACVRALNLAALGRAFPGEADVLEASRQALLDRSLWCRLYGAANLGREGEPLLREVLGDIRNGTFQRATALYHLGRVLPAEEAEPLFLRHLGSLEWPVLLAAVQGLGEGAGTVRAVPALLRLAETAAFKDVRVQAGEAAARIRSKLSTGEGWLSVAAGDGDEGRLSRPGGE